MPNSKSQYQTKWVQKLPPIGEQCPICEKGILQEGKYGGILCYECKTVWKLSKYPPKTTIPQTSILKTDVPHEETMKALREIYKEVKALQESFKAFSQIFGKADKKE